MKQPIQYTRSLVETIGTRLGFSQPANTLPDRPSELILCALQDLARVEEDPRYEVHMGSWHRALGNAACQVCLAGAVMAKRFNLDSRRDFEPQDVPGMVMKLYALDAFRMGLVSGGLSHLGIRRPEQVPAVASIEEYDNSPERFKVDMRKLAITLRKAGL